jgi:hypothetical protein
LEVFTGNMEQVEKEEDQGIGVDRVRSGARQQSAGGPKGSLARP